MSKDDHIQRRSRSEYHGVADVISGEKTISNVYIRNISLNGIYVETSKGLTLNEKCELIIKLGENGSVELEIKGNIVRADGEGLGIRFVEMSPVTLDHLRKVVMYNSDDPEDFLQECEDRPGFK